MPHTAAASSVAPEAEGAQLSGGAARSLFALRSACFDVSEQDGVFTFSVTGYGAASSVAPEAEEKNTAWMGPPS
mgnify:CR=1 FL=1